MKLNWGTGITIFIIVFVVFMSALVFKATQQNHDLVTTDYYAKELDFQELIERKELAESSFKEQVFCKIEDEKLKIVFSQEVEGNIHGTLHFFKPSDAKLDKTLTFQSESKELQYPLTLFSKGMYQLKIEWADTNHLYYNEITIQL